MQVTVIGGGNGSHAAVVDQVLLGHEVRWYRRDRASLPPDGRVAYDGILGEGQVSPALLTDDITEAVAGADLVLAPIPADLQPALFEDLLPVLEPGQVVAFTPGTGGTILAHRRRPDVAFLETGTLPYLTRVTGPHRVSIPVVSARLPVGSEPSSGPLADVAHQRFAQAYPAAVRLRDGLDAALTNWGPVIHPPLLVHNLGAIESLGDRFDIHGEGTTPAVRRTQIALDQERIALRRALALPGGDWPLSDYYAGSETSMYPPDAKQRLLDSDLWRETLTLEHRYLTEDVACGLVLNVSLAHLVAVPAPVGDAILALLGVALERNLLADGRTAASVGLTGRRAAETVAVDG